MHIVSHQTFCKKKERKKCEWSHHSKNGFSFPGIVFHAYFVISSYQTLLEVAGLETSHPPVEKQRFQSVVLNGGHAVFRRSRGKRRKNEGP
jgi:hypothetical protein